MNSMANFRQARTFWLIFSLWLPGWNVALATLAEEILADEVSTPAETSDMDLTERDRAQLQQMREFWESLDPKKGDVALPGGLVTLHVPEDYYFLDGADSKRVLVEAWGNPPGQNVLGMLFPEAYTPFDARAWAVTIEYSDEGYVSDEDAADIDYDDMLETMQQDTLDANPGRIEAGYGAVELLGWAEPPHYDSATKKLYWAKEIRFDDSSETTLNYEIRSLGRQGVLSMTFIAATPQLEEINTSRDTVLAMAQFNPGHTYAEFDPSIDKVAAYGIGALIAGKVAAKVGLLAGGLLLLKKFGVFILLGLAAAAGKLKKYLGRGNGAE